ncbi:MAG: HAD family phosphatase [Verrucomicrobiota bacterium]
MKIPEVVVFDLGKVLVDFDYNIASRKIANRGKMSAGEVQRFIDHSPLLFRYETGLMTKENFFSEICAATGFCGEFDEFASHFADIFSPIEPMIAWHRSLQEKGIPTYIFSNTNELAIAHIRERFPFFANFTNYIFSYEHGAMKPDAKLYEVVERISGKSGAAILYLDDRVENVATGAVRGWQTILQESPEKTLKLVQQFGF